MSNPIIEAVDDGHYAKSVKGEGDICRADAEPFPCSTIRAARSRHAQQMLSTERTALQRMSHRKS